MGSKEGHHNRIYAIGSTLLQDESTDALVIINLCKGWDQIEGVRIIPLPSQQCACHRIAYCDVKGKEEDDVEDEDVDGSVFITELSKAKILQVKVNQDIYMHLLDTTVSVRDGF